MENLISITSPAELENILKTKPNVIVDFYADWCGPCKQLLPVLEMTAKDKPDVTICKVNVDGNAELSATYGVTSIPAVFFIKDGAQKHSTKGFMGKNQMYTLVQNYFGV